MKTPIFLLTQTFQQALILTSNKHLVFRILGERPYGILTPDRSLLFCFPLELGAEIRETYTPMPVEDVFTYDYEFLISKNYRSWHYL